MIYDRVLTIFGQASGSSPLNRQLTSGVEHYYRELEVFASRYFAAYQAGETISALVELPRMEAERIEGNAFCELDDGTLYRVVQAQYGQDANGLPITTLSLKTVEGKYDILRT